MGNVAKCTITGAPRRKDLKPDTAKVLIALAKTNGEVTTERGRCIDIKQP